MTGQTTAQQDAGLDFETRQIHAGARIDAENHARVTPIYLTAGYLFDDFDDAEAQFAGDGSGYYYSRIGNPTNAVVEERIASLEGGSAALLTSSGQAASTAAFLALVGAGDHVVASSSIYEGTKALLRDTLGRLAVDVELVEDSDDLAEWRRRINPRTRFLFAETIPNPKNDVTDLEGISGIAAEHGLPFVVDNTVATPYLARPIEAGAAIVLHSTSKFLSGHASVIGGAVVDGGRYDWAARPELFPQLNAPFRPGRESWVQRYGNRAFAEYTRTKVVSSLGPAASPFNSFLLLQGIETLSLRMERHAANALAVASWLEQQPEVLYVDYAGLPSSRYHERAARQLPRGAGSVFGFALDGGRDAARGFIDALELFSRMTHIGDVRSLAIHPASTTHAKISRRERLEGGIDDGLIRLSIGIESTRDLIADLARAFARLREESLLPA